MIQNTISTEQARRFYDRLGASKDASERYEQHAKARALALLLASPGQRVLNVGVGTGHEQERLQAMVAPDGLAVGIDLSRVMLGLTFARTHTPLYAAHAQFLPFADTSFDRLCSTYVLDLIPLAKIPHILSEFRRVLRPGGRMVLVSLTEGVTMRSQMFIRLWKIAYAINPQLCGGCRPLQLTELVQQAGFTLITREVIVQAGFPSEIIVATC